MNYPTLVERINEIIDIYREDDFRYPASSERLVSIFSELETSINDLLGIGAMLTLLDLSSLTPKQKRAIQDFIDRVEAYVPTLQDTLSKALEELQK